RLRLDGFEETDQTVDIETNTYLDLPMQRLGGATQLTGGATQLLRGATQVLRVPPGSRLPLALAIGGAVALALLIVGVAAAALSRGPDSGGTTVVAVVTA